MGQYSWQQNFWAHAIIPVKKLYLMQFCEINICQFLVFRHYTVYKKHDDDKNWQLIERKIESIIASARIILRPTVMEQLS